MTYPKDKTIKITAILLVLLSIGLRASAVLHSNYDMVTYNLPWYQTIFQKGIGNALSTNFSNYTPPYTYFLALAVLAHDHIPPLIAIKLIPICFDLLGAFYIYKIVKLKYQHGSIPYLAAAVYFAAPTVILNSAYWGQVDSLYTSFLLVCLYYLLTEKPLISMLSFGVAFSIKAQAIFFLPFLVILAIRKKIPWRYFVMIPLVYVLAILPTVLLGRPFLETLLIYANQYDSVAILSVNAPNLYTLFSGEWYSPVLSIGIVVAIILTAYWMYFTLRHRLDLDTKHIILIAFISTALIPFLFPKMHDRYFYTADVLSIVLALYWPALWFIPIFYQIISICAISVFLFNGNSSLVVFGFLLNTIALAIVLRTQRLAGKADAMDHTASSILSWLVAILVPVILFGFSINFFLTPYFIRMEYALPHISTDDYGFSKSERFHWASQTMNYLNSNKQSQYLARQKFEDGNLVFNDYEVSLVDNIKNSIRKARIIWNLSLAVTFTLGLLAWAGDWLPKFRQGTKRGAWLTVILAAGFGIAVFISTGGKLKFLLQATDTILRLFPVQIWQDFLLFVSISLIVSGLLLALSLTKIENMKAD